MDMSARMDVEDGVRPTDEMRPDAPLAARDAAYWRPDAARARDYSLLGEDGRLAVENGLTGAEWYACPIPRKRMKELMQRDDGPATRDTALWLGLLAAFALASIALWTLVSPWAAIPALFAYGVLYGSAGDSRWHECGHGTAFKTRWKNNAVYQLACFMMIREPEIWRWSHTRHHSDTIIVGRDPEIVAMRPTDGLKLLGMFVAFPGAPRAMGRLVMHAFGRMGAEEADYVPESEWGSVFRTARIWLAIHAVPPMLAILTGSWLPVLLVGPLPAMYGAWLHVVYGLTQHAGLDEDILDHRLNSRTVMMGPVNRFIYWNMNYHVEHHMFPMVPYHRLPELHAEMKAWCPTPYAGLVEAYREIVPTVLRQMKDPAHFVRRELPDGARALPDGARALPDGARALPAAA